MKGINMKLTPCNKYGWPVERIKGQYIQNFLRILIHTRKLKWWPPKHRENTTDNTATTCATQSLQNYSN